MGNDEAINRRRQRRMRSLIRRTVADLAETIHECSDGAEALTAYHTNRPDCGNAKLATKLDTRELGDQALSSNLRREYN